MNKKELLEQIILQLKQELRLITDAAKNTYDIATSQESKAENKYDTRGLEASYLAGAQAERVAEMKETIGVLEALKVKDFGKEAAIAFSALIDLDQNGKKQTVFFLPKGGGFKINYDQKMIQVVTPDSPLGEGLMGLSEGDVLDIDAGATSKEFEILKVY